MCSRRGSFFSSNKKGFWRPGVGRPNSSHNGQRGEGEAHADVELFACVLRVSECRQHKYDPSCRRCTEYTRARRALTNLMHDLSFGCLIEYTAFSLIFDILLVFFDGHNNIITTRFFPETSCTIPA